MMGLSKVYFNRVYIMVSLVGKTVEYPYNLFETSTGVVIMHNQENGQLIIQDTEDKQQYMGQDYLVKIIQNNS